MARERRRGEPPAEDLGAGGRERTVESEPPSSHLPGSLEHVGDVDEVDAGIARGAAAADQLEEPAVDAGDRNGAEAPGDLAATDAGDADYGVADEDAVYGVGPADDASDEAAQDADVDQEAYDPDAAYDSGAGYDADADYSGAEGADTLEADTGGGSWGEPPRGDGFGGDAEDAADDEGPSDEPGGRTTTTRVGRAGGPERPQPSPRREPAGGRARARQHPEDAEPRESLLARAIAFLRASWAELQRVQWPDRRHTFQATAVVVGFVVVAGVYLGVADWVAGKLVNLVI